MKILFVNNDKGWGGGQEHMKALATQLVRLGHETCFLCRAGSPSERNFRLTGVPVHGVPGKGRRVVAALLRSAQLMKREMFDIILVTREHDLLRTFLAWKLAFPFTRRGKFVMAYHTVTRRKQPFLGSVDAVVCISDFVRDKLLAVHRQLTLPVAVLHNGIPLESAPPASKFTLSRERRFFTATSFPLIGMVGAFFKNQQELIETIPLIKEKFPTLKVALVGDDSDAGLTGPILEKIRALGLTDDVIITGKVPHERLNDIYFDLDLSVSTFRNEGFGLVHLESLAAGTPVVAYNEGGQVDIFRGSTAGMLVDGGPQQFAHAVVDLLLDHENRFAMGRRGVELVNSTFSVAEMGRRYQDFFDKLFTTGCAGGDTPDNEL